MVNLGADGALGGTGVNADSFGIRTNGAAASDLNFVTASNVAAGVDLDVLNLGTATLGDLIDQFAIQTGGKVVACINDTQDGLVFKDTTQGAAELTVAIGLASGALVDLGFGVGQSDKDHDHDLEGGTIMSRLYLKPYDDGTGTGSYVAAGLSADVPDLHLGAALGLLEIGVSGRTTAPVDVAALGKL